MSQPYTIREAGPSDAEALCRLICDLARFEKLEHEAAPDPERLARDLAPSAARSCGAFIAESVDGRALGFALIYYKYSTFLTDWGVHLEDLYVHPESRRLGIGTALMTAVARHTVAAGCRRLELSVLDWNSGAIRFYEQLGGRAMDDWTTFRFVGESLTSLGDPSTTTA